jgi:hypothetical protein
MNFYVTVKLKNIPRIKKMIKIMYFDGADYSWAGNDYSLRFGDGTEFCWDKWMDDARWSEREDTKTYISIQRENDSILHIQSDDEIPFVDQRAIVILMNYLLKRDETSLWSTDGKEWHDYKKFLVEYREILEYSFESALELSLK